MPSRGGKSEQEAESTEKITKGRMKMRLRESPNTALLTMVAVVVAVVALIIALVVPRPGPITSQNSYGGYAAIGSSCTNYPGARVSITVPGAGTIVVSATVGVGINHTFGISDTALIVVAASAMECTVNNYAAWVSVPYSLPTDPYHFTTVPILRSFIVDAAGTMTFYVNGIMTLGADANDRFDSASLVAVYYPR